MAAWAQFVDQLRLFAITPDTTAGVGNMTSGVLPEKKKIILFAKWFHAMSHEGTKSYTLDLYND